jgi:hypothetical protein
MASYHDRESFLPFRNAELAELLAQEPALAPHGAEHFRRFSKLLQRVYHAEFHPQRQQLKEDFAPFDPDRATRAAPPLPPELLEQHEARLFSGFRQVLTRANYHPISQEDLDRAFASESLFHISLSVDFNDFERYLLFRRGDVAFHHTVKPWLRKPKQVPVPAYERVAMLLKFQDAPSFATSPRQT